MLDAKVGCVRTAASPIAVFGALVALVGCGGDGADPPQATPETVVPPGLPAREPIASYVTDSGVESIAVAGDVVYAAGFFERVGRPARGLAVFEKRSTEPAQAWPAIQEGDVSAIAPDGSGGWVLGGSFAQVDGHPCPRLAHITSARQLDRRLCLAPDNAVTTLARVGRTLFVGGWFHTIGHERRALLAAVDLESGAVLPTDLDVAGRPVPAARDFESDAPPRVEALATHGDTLFVGGLFESIGGQSRVNLAAVDATSVSVLRWHADAGSWPLDWVTKLAVGPDAVYVGGAFDALGGRPADGLGAIDPRTGARLRWKPAVPWTWFHGSFIADHDRVYLASDRRVRAVDARTGANVASFKPVTVGGVVGNWSLAVLGDRLCLGGGFERVNGQPRASLAAVDRTTGKLLNWKPRAIGIASALAAVHGVLAAGGVSGASGAQTGPLVSIDGRTGRILPWAPRFDGAVSALATTASRVYVGGSFRKVNGVTRGGLAAFDVTTGALTDWSPVLEPAEEFDESFLVQRIGVADETVYVAGEFAVANGEPRQRLAAFDASSGQLDPWDPGLIGTGSDGKALNLTALESVDGLIWVAGDIESVGGLPRDGFAAVDAESGEVSDWTPSVGLGSDGIYGVITVASAGGVLYLGGDFTSIEGVPRQGLAAVDSATHEVLRWGPTLRGGEISTQAIDLEVVGKYVVVVGDFSRMNAKPRRSIALADRLTGRLLPWHPSGRQTSTQWAETLDASSTVLAFGEPHSINVYRLAVSR